MKTQLSNVCVRRSAGLGRKHTAVNSHVDCLLINTFGLCLKEVENKSKANRNQ